MCGLPAHPAKSGGVENIDLDHKKWEQVVILLRELSASVRRWSLVEVDHMPLAIYD